MSEMIERVSRAIMASDGWRPETIAENWRDYEGRAIAAIAEYEAILKEQGLVVAPKSKVIQIRTGDTVKHKITGETWVVAYVDGEKLAWCGWPPGEAYVADCELVSSCTDEVHWQWVRDIVGIHKSASGHTDKRVLMCQQMLAEKARIDAAPGGKEWPK